MKTHINPKSVTITQNVDKSIAVMYDAGTWLVESGKKPSKWWKPENMNRKFLLQRAEANEFYVLLVDTVPAASVILQDNQRNQSWKNIDKESPKDALYIHWLCVDRKFRGLNVPKLLIDFAKDKAKERGIHLLRLDTKADEVKLRNIYEHLGFKLVGTEQEGSHRVAFYQKKI